MPASYQFIIQKKQIMKAILFTIAFLPFIVQGQIQNGSFENSSGADLSNWEWTCGADTVNTAPPSGGNWCIKVVGGNMQGCFPGYAYQRLPSIIAAQPYQLTGWASAIASSMVGLYFGVINNGVITLQDGDTTSSAAWTQLQVISTFNLSAGDTPVVVLFGGVSTGPVFNYGYFDLIEMSVYDGVNELDHQHLLTIFPNPVLSGFQINSSVNVSNAKLELIDCIGRVAGAYDHLNGQTFNFDPGNLSAGVYSARLSENGQILSNARFVFLGN